MDITVVSGVPGLGSSTVTEAAVASLDDRYELLDTADIMLEEALSSGVDVSGRDDLSKMTPQAIRRLQRRMGEYVAEIAAELETYVVLNTHLVVNTTAGFIAGLPPEVLSELDPDAFVLVEADPELIQERRVDSNYLQYRVDDLLGIEFQQSMSRTAAFSYSTAVGAPITLVEHMDTVESAAARLSEEIETAATR